MRVLEYGCKKEKGEGDNEEKPVDIRELLTLN